MAFRVVEVIDGDTFRVSPPWQWQGRRGDIVRVLGYDAPEEGEPGYWEAKDKLTRLIFGKEVELRDPVRITYGRLLCEVYVGGRNLADFFPEYQ